MCLSLSFSSGHHLDVRSGKVVRSTHTHVCQIVEIEVTHCASNLVKTVILKGTRIKSASDFIGTTGLCTGPLGMMQHKVVGHTLAFTMVQ